MTPIADPRAVEAEKHAREKYPALFEKNAGVIDSAISDFKAGWAACSAAGPATREKEYAEEKTIEDAQAKKDVEELVIALKDAQVEFERIASLRSQSLDKTSTHSFERGLARGSQAFAMAAATEISRILSMNRFRPSQSSGVEHE